MNSNASPPVGHIFLDISFVTASVRLTRRLPAHPRISTPTVTAAFVCGPHLVWPIRDATIAALEHLQAAVAEPAAVLLAAGTPGWVSPTSASIDWAHAADIAVDQALERIAKLVVQAETGRP